MKLSFCRWIVVVILFGTFASCKSDSSSNEKKVTKKDLEGQVMVQNDSKHSPSKPDLLLAIKRAIITKENNQFNLNFKSKGTVQDWTFTQVLKTKLKVKGDNIVGLQDHGGSYRFYFIEKTGKPEMAEYRLIQDSSSVSGKIGENLDFQLSFQKSRTLDGEGKPYAQRMPARIKLTAELKPEWI